MLVYFSNELGLARTERGQPAFPGASPIRQDCMERERERVHKARNVFFAQQCVISLLVLHLQMFCPGASCPGITRNRMIVVQIWQKVAPFDYNG